METPVEIFLCYAREDEQLRQELEKQLWPLKQQGLIDIWYDRQINAGVEWEREIENHLKRAQIILLLISPDFMSSDYCYSVEMKQAMARHQRREARVIPIILRPVYFQGAPFGNLQVLPRDATPVTSEKWHRLDDAFYSVAEGIRTTIEESATYPQLASNEEIPPPMNTSILSEETEKFPIHDQWFSIPLRNIDTILERQPIIDEWISSKQKVIVLNTILASLLILSEILLFPFGWPLETGLMLLIVFLVSLRSYATSRVISNKMPKIRSGLIACIQADISFTGSLWLMVLVVDILRTFLKIPSVQLSLSFSTLLVIGASMLCGFVGERKSRNVTAKRTPDQIAQLAKQGKWGSPEQIYHTQMVPFTMLGIICGSLLTSIFLSFLPLPGVFIGVVRFIVLLAIPFCAIFWIESANKRQGQLIYVYTTALVSFITEKQTKSSVQWENVQEITHLSGNGLTTLVTRTGERIVLNKNIWRIDSLRTQIWQRVMSTRTNQFAEQHHLGKRNNDEYYYTTDQSQCISFHDEGLVTSLIEYMDLIALRWDDIQGVFVPYSYSAGPFVCIILITQKGQQIFLSNEFRHCTPFIVQKVNNLRLQQIDKQQLGKRVSQHKALDESQSVFLYAGGLAICTFYSPMRILYWKDILSITQFKPFFTYSQSIVLTTKKREQFILSDLSDIEKLRKYIQKEIK